MEVDPPEFHLAAELRGHLEDVRGVISVEHQEGVPVPFIATSSRDRTVKVWQEENGRFKDSKALIGHTDFVAPIAFLPAQPSLASIVPPSGALVSGSRDKNIIVWDHQASGTPLHTFTGHAYQVSALAILPSGDIVSGSLDKSIKIWSLLSKSVITTLEGHEGPVLSLLVSPSGEILSGSGDHTIKVWSQVWSQASASWTCKATLNGHTDSVRGLCSYPSLGFVSCSHDMSLKVWDMQGSCISDLIGHTALVYACAVQAGGGLIASGSEDGTARIWQPSGACIQVINHPGCIWSVCFKEMDLVTGCSDSVARIWSIDKSKNAPEEVRIALESYLSELQAAKNQSSSSGPSGAGEGGMGGLPPDLKIHPPSSILQPGSKEGEIRVVKETNGAINAYVWDSNAFKWEMIGEVMPSPGNAGGSGSASGGIKKMHEGHLYDHIIDVDVSENSPPLKLAFNSEEDPREVAETFLLRHGLPSSYREQIVEFIRRNTAVNFNASGSVTGGFCDPFTGGGGSDGGQGQSSRSGLSHVPATKYLAFDTPINFEGLRKKLKEFDALVGSDVSTAHLSLGLGNNEGDASTSLETLFKKLPGSVLSNGIDKSLSFTSQDLALLEKLLSWPAAYLFPAIDATRALILDAGAAKLLSSSPSVLSRVISALESASPTMDPKAASVNQQLALKVASNAFKHPETRVWVVGQGVREKLFESCPVCCTPQSSKAVRLSMATLLHNMSILFKGPSTIDESAAEAKVQVFSALVDLLGSSVGPGQEEMSEVAYTGLVALGTIMYEDKELTALARDVGVNEVIKKIHADPATKQPSGNKLLQAAVDITRLMG